MQLKLTESEAELAERLVAGLERRGRIWPRQRWFFVLFGLALIGIAGASFVSLEHLLKQDFAAQMVDEADPPAFVLKTYVRQSFNELLALVGLYISAIICGSVGAFMLVRGLSLWNQHRTHCLIAKVLRAKLESEFGLPPKKETASGVSEHLGIRKRLAIVLRRVWEGTARSGEVSALALAVVFLLAALASVATYLVAWATAEFRWFAASDAVVISCYSSAGGAFLLLMCFLLARRLRRRAPADPGGLESTVAKTTASVTLSALGQSLPLVLAVWLVAWSLGTWLVRAVPGEGEWLGIAVVCLASAFTLVTWLLTWRLVRDGRSMMWWATVYHWLSTRVPEEPAEDQSDEK